MKECQFEKTYGHKLRDCHGTFEEVHHNNKHCPHCQKESSRRANFNYIIKNKINRYKFKTQNNPETGLLEIVAECKRCKTDFIREDRELYCPTCQAFNKTRKGVRQYFKDKREREKEESKLRREKRLITISDLQRSTPVKFVSMVDDINSGKVVLGRI